MHREYPEQNRVIFRESSEQNQFMHREYPEQNRFIFRESSEQNQFMHREYPEQNRFMYRELPELSHVDVARNIISSVPHRPLANTLISARPNSKPSACMM